MVTPRRKTIPEETAIVGPDGMFRMYDEKSPNKVIITASIGVKINICLSEPANNLTVLAGITRSALTRIMPTNFMPATIETAKST